MFQSPVVLTPSRIRLAYVVAVAADVVQLVLGPLGWLTADAAVDVAAMIATSRLLGFHPLLLPTFVLELVPVADLLPSWTGCVALVVALRKKQHAPPPPGSGHVIDV
jgi:hypothetical protein